VACLEQKFWNNLCRVCGHPEWQEQIKETKNYPALIRELTACFKEKTLAAWDKLLAGQDTCVRPVLNFAEAVALEQTRADAMVLTLQDEELGTYKQMGFPMKFSRTPCQVSRRAPRLGEDTEAVLASLRAKLR
jgi:crotonobetainyl-CoA:carnitine CoA-transferase CaiB-like acyl-CoA transferase